MNMFINFIRTNWIKILAAILLLWALADNPYSYYQFLRWAILAIGAYTSYISYKQHKIAWAWIFGIMAVLFNPIIPFYLSKDNWQFIDVVAAIVFFISIFQKYENQN